MSEAAKKHAGPLAEAERTVAVRRFGQGEICEDADSVAVEEPLEISCIWSGEGDRVDHEKAIAVTMRTPGSDIQLALGFLFTEGVISSWTDVADVHLNEPNKVAVELAECADSGVMSVERNFYVSSSCGVCGKASLEAINVKAPFELEKTALQLAPDVLADLPAQLEKKQQIFHGTGSIHAAALFDSEGLCGEVFEDVGRHNAVDKLVGAALSERRLPLSGRGVLVSGRASFELVQKARMAGCSMLAAVGAPSSLAIELAWETGITLVGFIRDDRFNVYTGPARVLC